jgi:hypothetical protein
VVRHATLGATPWIRATARAYDATGAASSAAPLDLGRASDGAAASRVDLREVSDLRHRHGSEDSVYV